MLNRAGRATFRLKTGGPVRSIPLKAVWLIPALAVGWVVFCLVDLIRAKQVRYLPKWGWAILCLGVGLTIPFGGLLYLVAGRVRSPKAPRTGQRQAGSS